MNLLVDPAQRQVDHNTSPDDQLTTLSNAADAGHTTPYISPLVLERFGLHPVGV
jgi:hypothetical protein